MPVEAGDLSTDTQYLRDIKAALGGGDLSTMQADIALIKADLAAIRAILES